VGVERLHSHGCGVIDNIIGGGDLLSALTGYNWEGRMVILCHFCKKNGLLMDGETF